ncbi:MAG: outer membrane lipoprotein carrier protein LolA [Desulfocapsaceae bacterium]|nr:outer membrane lipoprotein carrier protein LolA [Desulfocapsaceae bacterium]
MRRLLFCLLLVPMLLVRTSGLDAETHERLRSVQGDFVQETHMKILARPLVSHGMLAFQAPESLRWEYRDPVRSIMFMHKGTMEKMVERDGRFEQDQSVGAGSMQIILPEISNWLDGRFAENPIFITNRIDERTIVLTPKDPGLQAIISSIELRLGEQEGVMESVTIHEGPDAFTRLTFSNIVVNREIPESFFSRQ